MTRIGSRYYTDAEIQDIDSYVQEKEHLAKIEVLENLYSHFKAVLPFGEANYTCVEIARQLTILKGGQ